MATHLVALGLDVNAKEKLGMTPLHHAASSEEVGADLIKCLVDLCISLAELASKEPQF